MAEKRYRFSSKSDWKRGPRYSPPLLRSVEWPHTYGHTGRSASHWTRHWKLSNETSPNDDREEGGLRFAHSRLNGVPWWLYDFFQVNKRLLLPQLLKCIIQALSNLHAGQFHRIVRVCELLSEIVLTASFCPLLGRTWPKFTRVFETNTLPNCVQKWK